MGKVCGATLESVVRLYLPVAFARYNVRCNAVAIGWIDTPITQPPEQDEVLTLGQEAFKVGVPLTAKKFRDTSAIPLGRCGTAGKVAGCMLFLASLLSSYVTGDVLQCTGGRSM